RADRSGGRHLAAFSLPPVRYEEGAVQSGRRPLFPRDARALPAGRRGEARGCCPGGDGHGLYGPAFARPDAIAGPDAGLRCLPRPGGPRGGAEWLRRPGRIRRARVRTAGAGDRGILRERHAPQRRRGPGAPARGRALGGPAGQRMRREVSPLFFGIHVSDYSQARRLAPTGGSSRFRERPATAGGTPPFPPTPPLSPLRRQAASPPASRPTHTQPTGPPLPPPPPSMPP